VDASVTFTAVLDVREDAVFFLARLLWLRRERRPGYNRPAVTSGRFEPGRGPGKRVQPVPANARNGEPVPPRNPDPPR
jgi:hypothetical protein